MSYFFLYPTGQVGEVPVTDLVSLSLTHVMVWVVAVAFWVIFIFISFDQNEAALERGLWPGRSDVVGNFLKGLHAHTVME